MKPVMKKVLIWGSLGVGLAWLTWKIFHKPPVSPLVAQRQVKLMEAMGQPVPPALRALATGKA